MLGTEFRREKEPGFRSAVQSYTYYHGGASGPIEQGSAIALKSDLQPSIDFK
jgi:hypothetical protein